MYMKTKLDLCGDPLSEATIFGLNRLGEELSLSNTDDVRISLEILSMVNAIFALLLFSIENKRFPFGSVSESLACPALRELSFPGDCLGLRHCRQTRQKLERVGSV